MSPNSQLHLTNDSFLYACQSEFAARTKKNGSFNSHIRYEPFLLGQYERPQNATMRDFAQVVNAITQHHFQVTPQFRRHESLTIDTVSYFTCAIATLFADLETACKEYFGIGLPAIPAEPPEYSNETPVSKALILARNGYIGKSLDNVSSLEAFEPFPLQEFPAMNATEQATIWSCEVWDAIADAIHSSLFEYADTAMGFAYWKYQQQETKPEIDWRIRPPVGEAFAKVFKPLQRSARGDRSRGGSDRGERSGDDSRFNRKSVDKRPRPAHQPDAAQHQPTAPHAKDSERPAPKASEQRGGPHREHQGRSGRPGPGGEGREFHQKSSARHERSAPAQASASSERQIEEALQEVQTAVANLKNNPKLGEIALKPANSFIRRQQHSLAVELGLDTESRGEGKDRGVVIRLNS